MDFLRVYAVTYNVGTNGPDQHLGNLLPFEGLKNIPDFIVISLQEVKAQPQSLLISALFDDPWTNTCKDYLKARDYVKVKSIRLQGLLMSVYVLRKHLLNIRDIESEYTRTGLSGMWGNKGAVSVRLSIYGCSICFVNAHLSAHDQMLDNRIEDYNSIIKDQKFHVSEHTAILYHDYVFWMGDLNFRLVEEYEKSPEEIWDMVKRKDIKSLLMFDQLQYVRNRGEAFSEFEEGEIKFPPTYKFEKDEDEYDMKRRPAWTDRILFKVHTDNYDNIKLSIKQNSYTYHPFYKLSDHKPVSSDFTIKIPRPEQIDSIHTRSVQVFADYAEEVIQFHNIQFWWTDHENTATYTINKEIEKSKEDWIGIFKDDYSSLDDYVLYEYVYKNNSPEPIPRNEAHSKPIVQPGTYSITFSEIAGERREGRYRLVYFAQTKDKVQSVLGISNTFLLKERPGN